MSENQSPVSMSLEQMMNEAFSRKPIGAVEMVCTADTRDEIMRALENNIAADHRLWIPMDGVSEKGPNEKSAENPVKNDNAQSNILTEANAIIYGDREKTYGSPAKNLETIAKYWTAHLQARGKLVEDERLTIDDVALMMTGLKLARLGNDTRHRDSQVDACGYLGLLERVQQ